MSKIGNLPIKIPQGVEVTIEKQKALVKGSKGELVVSVPKDINIEMTQDILVVKRSNDFKETKALHGLIRSLINNAILGVSEGFKKTLELSGVGFRAILQGEKLTLSLGYSHPVEVEKPEGVSFSVAENKITVLGIDKGLVGNTAAKLRKIRPAEPYKGKGIKYEGETIRRKSGKAQAAGGK
ncbi:MAG: 50S ribosomal protein L6 [Candidatus Woykebacteria bacterium]